MAWVTHLRPPQTYSGDSLFPFFYTPTGSLPNATISSGDWSGVGTGTSVVGGKATLWPSWLKGMQGGAPVRGSAAGKQ